MAAFVLIGVYFLCEIVRKRL